MSQGLSNNDLMSSEEGSCDELDSFLHNDDKSDTDEDKDMDNMITDESDVDTNLEKLLAEIPILLIQEPIRDHSVNKKKGHDSE